MDRTQLCGSCDVGSIPTEGTSEKRVKRGNYQWASKEKPLSGSFFLLS